MLTAGITFHRARSAILERTRGTALAELRAQLASLAPDLVVPPGTRDLRGLARRLDQAGGARAWHAAAAYKDGPLLSASPGAPPVPDELRRAVQDGGTATYQYIERRGGSWLALGTPVAYADDPGRPGALSGLTVYAVLPSRRTRPTSGPWSPPPRPGRSRPSPSPWSRPCSPPAASCAPYGAFGTAPNASPRATSALACTPRGTTSSPP
ncbi:hypothetical protein ACFQHO_11305 [Actinomadura yumaensis]|uniref:hypothetical protein n=1 Tax=Actinomadura yumaensis TaxID=111807 RepID=UPI003613D760